MALIRHFARVSADGKITVPPSIQRETGLKKDQLVELRVVGIGKKKMLAVSAKDNAR